MPPTPPKKKKSASASEKHAGANTTSGPVVFSAVPPDGRVLVISVGIDSYSPNSGLADTPFAKSDAEGFASAIKSIFGPEKTDIHIITNNTATKSELEYSLKNFVPNLSDKDVFFFYYAGHGYHDANGNRITTWDSKAVAVSDTTLSLKDFLLDPLANSKCKRAVAFIDACATRLKDGGKRSALSKMNEQELKAFLNAAEYSAVFLSCKPGEESFPDSKLKHGIWTHFLIKALTGEDDNALDDNRYLTDQSLRDYLATVVPKHVTKSTEHKKSQTPFAVVSATGTFAIRHVPEPVIEVGAEGDYRALKFEIRREYLQHAESRRVRDLPEFKKHHKIHDTVTGQTIAWIDSLVAPTVADEVQSLYEAIKEAFGYRRDEIGRMENGGQANIDTPAFRFTIESRQSKSDPSQYRYVRNLEIRTIDKGDVEKLDSVFGAMFDRVVLHIEGLALNVDQITAKLEAGAEKHGGKVRDYTETVSYTTPSGIEIEFCPKEKRIRFYWPTKNSPSEIFEDVKSFQFGISGTSSILLS